VAHESTASGSSACSGLFFFSSRRRHTRFSRDWSSDVCSSDLNTMPAKQRDLAMVFQSYALYPHMKVADNMSFALKLAGQPRAEIDRRVREAAEILGLESLLDRLPRELSGGQRQRVAMGRDRKSTRLNS